MTKRWKLKTTSSNILLVLITLILVKAEWIKAENNNSWEVTNSIESIAYENSKVETHVYVGNEEIADYFFDSSANNGSFILEGINKCLDSFQLITCVKMLLLNRINDAVSFMEEAEIKQKDVRLLNGLLVFKLKNDTTAAAPSEENSELGLDDEISVKVRRIFHKRSLFINLLPKLQIEIEPAPGKHLGDIICFSYKVRQESELVNRDTDEGQEGRKRKGGGMSMMMIPQLIMMGLMPFTLASLKAMVMNAVMINMMALNGAIFMTIRNLVFGPRQGDNVKYVNYGYSKDRQTQSKRPVLIIHSPAAFVKQPQVHKKRVHGRPYFASQNHLPENYHFNSHFSNLKHYENPENANEYEGGYFIVEQKEHSGYGHGEEIQKRNEVWRLDGHYNLNATRGGNNFRNSNQRPKKENQKDGRNQRPKFNNLNIPLYR